MSHALHYARIRLVRDLLAAPEPFAFARFGDGELAVIDGEDQMRQSEWTWLGGDARYDELRRRLLASMRYRHPRYYVGISPEMGRLFGPAKLQEFYRLSGQPAENILTANLFAASNYPAFLQQVVPLFSTYDVNVICHRTSRSDRLPFPVARRFACGSNAWIRDPQLAVELGRHAAAAAGELYLFMAGPLSNLLIHQLHDANPGNTYLDVGSALDPFLFDYETRTYLTRYDAEIARASGGSER